jgi:hypothetical protein
MFDLPELLRHISEELHPHQVIAYGCVALLGQIPRAIVSSHSNRPLQDLADSVEAKCVVQTPHRPLAVLDALAPLYEKLDRKASDILKSAGAERRYQKLLGKDPVLRTTTLRDYYGQSEPDPALAAEHAEWVEACVSDLTDWRDDAKQRISEWIHG